MPRFGFVSWGVHVKIYLIVSKSILLKKTPECIDSCIQENSGFRVTGELPLRLDTTR